MRKIQVRLPDELIGALEREAEAADRSLSYVVRKALEAHVVGVVAKPAGKRELDRPIDLPRLGCPHDEVEKRTTAAMGTRRFCKDCGALLP